MTYQTNAAGGITMTIRTITPVVVVRLERMGGRASLARLAFTSSAVSGRVSLWCH